MHIRKLTAFPPRLSKRARRVWAVIDGEACLSLRELCARCDLSSTSVAAYQLQRLEAAGIIERTACKFRAYRVVERWSWVEL